MDNTSKFKWNSPFMKQCNVAIAAAIGAAQFGLTMGFTSSLLPQLRRPDSIIQVDESTESWIACLPIVGKLVINFAVPLFMAKFGRRTGCMISVAMAITGWMVIFMAKNVTTVIICRVFQGFSLGLSFNISPIYIGECASPKYRGMFLVIQSLIMVSGTSVSHFLGSQLKWQYTALVIAIICFIDLILLIFCPESPTYLIHKGKYDQGKKSFRRLRGNEEEEELMKMIEANILFQKSKERKQQSNFVLNKIRYLKQTVVKPEFYKPIFIMIHLSAGIVLSGTNLLATYAEDIYHEIIGKEKNVSLIIMSVDIQRLVSNTCAIFAIKRFKRKTMLLSTVTLNILTYLCIAGYVYGRNVGVLPDIPAVGVALIHIQMFSVSFGAMPVPFVIFGEIFPVEYKGLSNVISTLCIVPIDALILKTYPALSYSLGIYGAYCIYGVALTYTLVLSYIVLPETKDRTLQEIEETFRGKPKEPEEEAAETLTSEKV